MTIPAPPDFAVTSRLIDSRSVLEREPEQPYPVYIFGGGRKVFWSNRQGNGIYDKPTTTVDGVIVHEDDPDLETTISPVPVRDYGY
jgi:hypothetical protein